MTANKISDISQWQEQGSTVVDWNKAKAELELAIIRVQAGSSSPDTKYNEFVKGCKQNNIPFGTYAYAKFVSVPDATVEAKDCYTRMDKSTAFVVIDVESQSCHNPADLIPATQAFIDYLHTQGVKKVGLYSGQYFYDQYGFKAIKADFLWLAVYGINDGTAHATPSDPCDIWQFTSEGKVDGFIGHVDLDMLVGSKALSYFTGIAPTPAPTPVAPAEPLQPPFIPTNNGIIAKVKVLVAGDIRVAPTHNSLFVRNSVVGETFDVYANVNDWLNVGGANWVLDNNGLNLSMTAQYNPPLNPPAPTPAPVVAPKPVAPAPAPAPTVAPKVEATPVKVESAPVVPSANVTAPVSANVSKAPVSANTVVPASANATVEKPTTPVVAPVTPVTPVEAPKPVVSKPVVSAPVVSTEPIPVPVSGNTNDIQPLIQQVEDKVLADPQVQQSLIKKIFNFIMGLFK